MTLDLKKLAAANTLLGEAVVPTEHRAVYLDGRLYHCRCEACTAAWDKANGLEPER